MTKAIVSLSGGLDSTTLLAQACAERGAKNVAAIGFYYGSKHNVYENASALAVAHFYDVSFDLMDISPLFKQFESTLLKTGGAIPEGYYEGENMRQTVVPGRNTIFACILAGLAESKGYEEVWMGVHAGDHFIYPDCRPACINSLRDTIRASSDARVHLHTPYLNFDKTHILSIGFGLRVPYELTRTCYKAQEVACGKCGSCQERLTSFKLMGKEDPLPYDTRELVGK